MSNKERPIRPLGAFTNLDGDDAAGRPAMRSELRAPEDEDPRARAERRAAELLDRGLPIASDGIDDFYFPKEKVPDGWTYEWKRKTIANKEDPAYEVQLATMGWEAVPASRHPEEMPAGNFSTIERKEMILMERPASITEMAREKEAREARQRITGRADALREAPDGQFERSHDKAKPVIKKSYSPMQVPKEG